MARECDYSLKLLLHRVTALSRLSTVGRSVGGTISDGDARCPFPDCGRVIDGDEIKRQAQAGQMGDQLYAVVFKRKRITGHTRRRQREDKWERGFRAPRPADNSTAHVQQCLNDKLPEWEALDSIPSESIGELSNDDRGHRLYGMYKWVDLFSPRQLLCHGTAVSVYREMLEEERASWQSFRVAESRVHLSRTVLGQNETDYNSRMTRWIPAREVIANTFDRHNFSLKWAYVEMAPLIVGIGL